MAMNKLHNAETTQHSFIFSLNDYRNQIKKSQYPYSDFSIDTIRDPSR